MPINIVNIISLHIIFDLNFAYFLQFHFPHFHLKYAIWETLHMNNKFSTKTYVYTRLIKLKYS